MTTPEPEAQRKVLNRLRRARGQLDGVIAAVENGASCRDVVTQLAAVTHALNRAGFLVVSTAMEDCLAGPDTGESRDGLTADDLEKLFLTLA
ncbi:metal-sensitive transcriptional regulator [Brachybacterium saurashtrense]|uniref:Metal-sensitive transcriptional regulator n=1 Tax=Brachybacterium saurashtrense TaxID=556288 RepID=A0A345YLR2_9MICO|nr:metal-sensitive transcriptional regulator [Brachybacterium saurashtrense]AXK44864.1 metal-sensitive transcriptional regulator [Brachybacterium saurashtrense]RRR20727.1 metal-sensitive transcriptional regulator [Brachybacterium saurashtrense]